MLQGDEGCNSLFCYWNGIRLGQHDGLELVESRVTRLSASTQGMAAALHSVLDDEEACELRDELLVALPKIGRRRQIAVELQPPIALVGLLERRQLPQAAVHLHAPAHTCHHHAHGSANSQFQPP